MRVGIDFDNTIVNYDQAFITIAKEWNIIPKNTLLKTKLQLRNYLLNELKNEEKWMKLQGYIYGKGMSYAELMPGFFEFLKKTYIKDIPIFVVSHKTEYGHFDEDKINLRQVALQWIKNQGLFAKNSSLKQNDIYFESTRIEKISRIKQLKCTHFIDDLPEVLLDEQFPMEVKRYLFSSDSNNRNSNFSICTNWEELQKVLLK